MGGYNTAVAGTTISAATFNTYVRDQVVSQFASASARDSAITSPVNGMLCYTTDLGAMWSYNGSKWLRRRVTVYSGADVGTGANNTTFGNVGWFSFSMDANSKYVFDSWVAYEAGATGDMKLQFTLPAGATIKWSTYGPPTTTTTGIDIGQGVLNTAAGPGLMGGTGFVQMVGRIAGTVTTSSTAGTAQLQFAQNANDAEATTIYADSWLSYEQVA